VDSDCPETMSFKVLNIRQYTRHFLYRLSKNILFERIVLLWCAE